MKKILIFSFTVLGFSSLVSQVVVTRELAMSFYGNEFFIGWILFCWLIGTAVGSALGSRATAEVRSLSRLLGLCHGLSALLFPLAIFLVRSGKMILATPPGSIPALSPSLIYSFAVLVPLCGVMGIQFTAAARVRASGDSRGDAAQMVGGAYLWECLGFVTGGIAFSFFLVFANEFRVAAILAILNFTAASLILNLAGEKRSHQLAMALLGLIFLIGLVVGSSAIQQKTSQFRFPNEKLLVTRNTIHGNVSVTRLGRQHDFYQNGLLLGADQADLASEYLVHFPMLAHSSPRRILILGTGFNGPLEEILKHAPAEVVSVELDPAIAKIAAGFLSEGPKKALIDPRVKFRSRDPLDFLRTEGGIFDVIISNFPDPVSVLVNRNYTERFFRLVRSHLAPDGIFATHITFAADFTTPVLARFGASVDATLRQVFPFVRILPEDTLFFIASANASLAWDAKVMAGRLLERKVRTDFVTADFIRYRLENDRVARVAAVFRNAAVKITNTDLRPRVCYFAFLRWLSQFDPHVSGGFSVLGGVPFSAILGLFLLVILFFGSWAKGFEKRTQRLALLSMGSAGFSLMASEILGIYLFQAAFGDLYYRLAWLITAFMAGLGAGTWLALKSGKISERPLLAALHLANAAFFLLLLPLCEGIFSGLFSLRAESQFIFLGVALLGGFWAGMVFPVANRLYLLKGQGKFLGSVYAADLGGSALGALLTAGFLIPIWGVLNTLVLLGAVNMLLVLLFLFRKDLGCKNL